MDSRSRAASRASRVSSSARAAIKPGQQGGQQSDRDRQSDQGPPGPISPIRTVDLFEGPALRRGSFSVTERMVARRLRGLPRFSPPADWPIVSAWAPLRCRCFISTAIRLTIRRSTSSTSKPSRRVRRSTTGSSARIATATCSNPADRAGRRRHDVRSRCRAVRRALRDPGAGDGRARFPLSARCDQRLGDDLHGGCRGRHGRPARRSACPAARCWRPTRW